MKVTKKNLTAGDGLVEDIVEVKLWDKVRALEALAKHFGVLREQIDVNMHFDMAATLRAARKRASERNRRPETPR